MADNNSGRRAVINDPLAPNPREQQPVHTLPLMGVRAPLTPSDASLTHTNELDKALTGVQGLMDAEFDKQKDRWITEGKVAFQTGVTEKDMLASGNKFTAQGYYTLQSRDTVNKWQIQQTIDIDNFSKSADPETFAAHLANERGNILKGITDPTALKVASAAFEQASPRLAAAQALKNNEYNHQQRISEFGNAIRSGGPTSPTASVRAPGEQLALAPVPVEAVMQPSARDRDIGIRTMLGEAADQGAVGMAAVAHVLRNRAVDPRFPHSIAEVALQPKQFSAWNSGAGGNSLVRNYGPGNPVYERAGQVFDAVMGGRNVDPTGGATHYYSPAGMSALVKNGDQANLIPHWLAAEEKRSGGSVRIGGHIFVGRSSGAQVRPSVQGVEPSGAQYGVTPDPVGVDPGGAQVGVALQNAVPVQQENVAVTGVAAPHSPNHTMEFINGYAGLNDHDKATAVSSAMVQSLISGDPSVFTDGGGIATLNRLGAKPAEVNAVIRAKKAYDEKKLTDFNVATQEFDDSIHKRAQAGEDVHTIFADIDKAHKASKFDDTHAKSLAESAAAEVRTFNKASHPAMSNPDFLQEIGGLYQRIDTGADPKAMAEQAKAIAARYNVPDADVRSIVGKMFDGNRAYQTKLRAEVASAAKLKATEDGVKSEVARTISQGYGLKDVTGNIKTTNARGQEQTVSAVDYGVQQIKQKYTKMYTDAVAEGKTTPEQAKNDLERHVALELQKHGVVDKDTVSQIRGALRGNIMNGNSGLKDGAVQAYDSWLTLRTTPGISPEWMKQVVPDADTRRLLETTYSYDGGTLSHDQALMKAHETLSQPNVGPEEALKRDDVWNAKLATETTKALKDKVDPGFWSKILGTNDPAAQDRILQDNKKAQNYVVTRATAYHMQNPRADAEVDLTMATQDLQAHSHAVLGNLIIDKPGKEMSKAMGVDGFGPTAVNDAVTQFIEKNHEALWGDQYSSRENSIVAEAVRNIPLVGTRSLPLRAIVTPPARTPPVSVTYDPESQIVSFDLYKDADKKQTLGLTKHFYVSAIGKNYVHEKTTPSLADRVWNSMFKSTMHGVKAAVEAGSPAQAMY